MKAGIGVGTDYGYKDGSVSAHVLGWGVTIGKKMGISILGNEISIDLGVL